MGLCPDIEGDVAFSSIAQDEVGHAVFYFELLHQLGEQDPDTLAFTRQINFRRNAVLLERPNQDWMYSMVRHFFYDAFDRYRLQAMKDSICTPLSHGAEKILNEERYHLIHLRSWFSRLGQAGEKARERLQTAISLVWSDLEGLFCCGLYEKQLLSEGIICYGSSEIKKCWIDYMVPIFEEAGLMWPGEFPPLQLNGRLGEHSDDLTRLLSIMTEVYEIDRVARW